MKLKDYSGFRNFLDLHGLVYEVDTMSNTYIVTDRKGNELITLDGFDVRNDFHKVRENLVTAVTVDRLFGG